MTKKSSPQITTEIVGMSTTCSLDELCESCKVEADWIAELVAHGVIEPIGQTKSDWTFASLSIVRVAKAKRLRRDLDLNLPGVALALDLLDEIEHLRLLLQVSGKADTERDEE